MAHFIKLNRLSFARDKDGSPIFIPTLLNMDMVVNIDPRDGENSYTCIYTKHKHIEVKEGLDEILKLSKENCL